MNIEDKLDNYICDYIFKYGVSPEQITLSVEHYRKLKKPSKFRGIPIVVKHNQEIVLDYKNNKYISEEEKEIIRSTKKHIEYVQHSLLSKDLQSEDFKCSMILLLEDILNEIKNKDVY